MNAHDSSQGAVVGRRPGAPARSRAVRVNRSRRSSGLGLNSPNAKEAILGSA